MNLQALEVDGALRRSDQRDAGAAADLARAPRMRVEHHAEIVKAIASGDAEEASRVAAAHVRAAGEDMLAQMRQVRMSSARGAAACRTPAGLAPQGRRRILSRSERGSRSLLRARDLISPSLLYMT